VTASAGAHVQETCLKRLVAFSKPFKYVVTAALTQKSGGGMHIASTSLWDDKTDCARPSRFSEFSPY